MRRLQWIRNIDRLAIVRPWGSSTGVVILWDGLVACASARIVLVETEDTNNEPTAHLADEHLQRLEDGLFEVLAILGRRRVTVLDALHVLASQHMRSYSCFAVVHTWNLVNKVLHTPVNSIIATRNGTAALTAMMAMS